MHRKSLVVGIIIGLIAGVLLGGNLVYFTTVREYEAELHDLSGRWNDLLIEIQNLDIEYTIARDRYDSETLHVFYTALDFIDDLRDMINEFFANVYKIAG